MTNVFRINFNYNEFKTAQNSTFFASKNCRDLSTILLCIVYIFQ